MYLIKYLEQLSHCEPQMDADGLSAEQSANSFVFIRGL